MYRLVEAWASSIDSYSADDLYASTSNDGPGYTNMNIEWDDQKRFRFSGSTSTLIGEADASYAPSIDINGVSRPQGSGSDVGAFEYRNTWVGGAAGATTDWNTAENWSFGVVPADGDDDNDSDDDDDDEDDVQCL